MAYNFIKKETRAQVFSCEFFKISKNTFFTEHLWTTAFQKVNPVGWSDSKYFSVGFKEASFNEACPLQIEGCRNKSQILWMIS